MNRCLVTERRLNDGSAIEKKKPCYAIKRDEFFLVQNKTDLLPEENPILTSHRSRRSHKFFFKHFGDILHVLNIFRNHMHVS